MEKENKSTAPKKAAPKKAAPKNKIPKVPFEVKERSCNITNGMMPR